MSVININVPKISAPTIAVVPASSIVKNVLSANVPKITAPSISLPTSPSIPSPGIPNISVAPPNISLPFSGTGLSGILAGGGPTFASVVLPNLQSIVPEFAPGLTISGGAIGSVISMAAAAKNSATQLQTLASNAQSEIQSSTQIPSVSVSTAPGMSGIKINRSNTA